MRRRNIEVSIIIPFYSDIHWLEEAMESVFSQTYQDFEVLLINDGASNIYLESLLKKYSQRIIYFFQKNSGPATARNKGIEMAKGKYIAFLDSDDLWHPNKLEQQVRYMKLNNCKWCHTNYKQFFNNDIKNFKSFKLNKYSYNIFPEALLSSHIATPSVMIEAEVLKNNISYRFNDSMRYGQDYYLWVLLSKSYNLCLLEEELVYVRIRGSNASKRARIHLKVRSDIWREMHKKGMENIFYGYKYSFIIRLAYKTTYRFSLINTKVLSLKRFNENYEEIISRIFFIIPYLFSKFLHYIFIKFLKKT